ncbi:MAG: hypothetical protein QM687_16165 [Ferruginibacter sp.]
MLRKELNIHNFKDLLEHYPLRHIDKTNVDKIATLRPNDEYGYVAGILADISLVGEGRGKRLVAHLKDDTGIIELVWFQGINWVQKSLAPGHAYLVFGKLSFSWASRRLLILMLKVIRHRKPRAGNTWSPSIRLPKN